MTYTTRGSTMLKAIFTIMTIAQCSSFTFDKRSDQPAIIFTQISRARTTHNTYDIYYHFDLRDFFKIAKGVETTINIAETICKRDTHLLMELCPQIIQQLKELESAMIRDQEDIQSFTHRARRAPIEIVGWAANKLFGIMDADEARAVKQNIDNLSDAQREQTQILHDQTMLVKGTLDLTNKTIHNMQTELKEVAKETMNVLTDVSKFRDITTLTSLILQDHYQLSRKIKTTLEGAIHGKITDLIPTKQLKSNLMFLQSTLHKDEELPIDVNRDNILHIFQFTTIRAALHDEYIIIKLSVPALDREEYTLYKPTPLPYFSDGLTHIINIPSEYVLIDTQNGKMTRLKLEDLKDNTIQTQKEMIIRPTTTTTYRPEHTCEYAMFLNETKNEVDTLCTTDIIPTTNYILPIDGKNKYYIFIVRPMNMHEHCHNKTATTIDIAQSGILTMSADCTAKTDTEELKGHKRQKIENYNIIEPIRTPNIDWTKMDENAKLHAVKLKIDDTIQIDNVEKLAELRQMADSILKREKNQLDMQKLQKQNMRHTIITTTSIGSSTLLLLIAIAWILIKKCRKPGVLIEQRVIHTPYPQRRSTSMIDIPDQNDED